MAPLNELIKLRSRKKSSIKNKIMATIKIQRKHEFINLFRDYRLFVNGQKIGSISDGQEKELTATIDFLAQ